MNSEYGVESSSPQVHVLEDEYETLADVVCASYRATPGIALLWQELERAQRLKADEAPNDLVRMGVRLAFTDLERQVSTFARLVYPQEAHRPDGIAVTTSVGAALLGLRKGQVFEWKETSGKRRAVRVDAVEQLAA